MRLEMLLLNEQVESTPQAGNNYNPVIEAMKKYRIPLTRENYLELAYMGEPPKELTAEEELELPEQLRIK